MSNLKPNPNMITYFLYIDPGSGSYLVQVIVAGALGVAFFFKNIGRFFKTRGGM
jgi:hypothetical protein